MWTTLALVAALQMTPSQPGGVTLSNVRFTHGFFGPARKEAAFLPGDAVFIAYEASNVKVNAAGKANCSLSLELLDASGKSLFKQLPRPQLASCTLGGNSLYSV